MPIRATVSGGAAVALGERVADTGRPEVSGPGDRCQDGGGSGGLQGGDCNAAGFCRPQRQAEPANEILARSTKRSSTDDLDGYAVDQTHFHEANGNAIVAAHLRDTSRVSDRELVESRSHAPIMRLNLNSSQRSNCGFPRRKSTISRLGRAVFVDFGAGEVIRMSRNPNAPAVDGGKASAW